MTFDLTPQLTANCQPFTAATSLPWHEWSPALQLGEKANMNYGKEFATLFWLSFLEAGGIPTMSPWKSWLFWSDSLFVNSSVQQQHRCPPALAALGSYSGHLLPLLPVLPCREDTVGYLCWLRSTFSIPTCVPFPAPFLWLHFAYLISGYRPWCLHSLESPSAEGLSPDMISQADSLSQLATDTRTSLLQRSSFWDLLCSAALSLSSAISAPAQKNPWTLPAAPQWHEISLGIVLTTAAQVFYFLEIQERESIRQEDQKPTVLNCPLSWIYPAF